MDRPHHYFTPFHPYRWHSCPEEMFKLKGPPLHSGCRVGGQRRGAGRSGDTCLGASRSCAMSVRESEIAGILR